MAVVALASNDDIQAFLPADKLLTDDDSDAVDLLNADARRVVKGYLSGQIDATVLAGWDSPDNTPEIIRAIAGRLVAAKFYKLRYSEDSLDVPQYAQDLYNEAIALLKCIIDGEILIDGVTLPDTFTNLDFWPNDSTVPAAFFSTSLQL